MKKMNMSSRTKGVATRMDLCTPRSDRRLMQRSTEEIAPSE